MLSDLEHVSLNLDSEYNQTVSPPVRLLLRLARGESVGQLSGIDSIRLGWLLYSYSGSIHYSIGVVGKASV